MSPKKSSPEVGIYKRKEESFSFFLVAFLVGERVFSFFLILSFFLDRFLGRERVFLLSFIFPPLVSLVLGSNMF